MDYLFESPKLRPISNDKPMEANRHANRVSFNSNNGNYNNHVPFNWAGQDSRPSYWQRNFNRTSNNINYGRYNYSNRNFPQRSVNTFQNSNRNTIYRHHTPSTTSPDRKQEITRKINTEKNKDDYKSSKKNVVKPSIEKKIELINSAENSIPKHTANNIVASKKSKPDINGENVMNKILCLSTEKIKNIINSSTTIYNGAISQYSEKKSQEKYIQSLNNCLPEKSNNAAANFEADEIVDANELPIEFLSRLFGNEPKSTLDAKEISKQSAQNDQAVDRRKFNIKDIPQTLTDISVLAQNAVEIKMEPNLENYKSDVLESNNKIDLSIVKYEKDEVNIPVKMDTIQFEDITVMNKSIDAEESVQIIEAEQTQDIVIDLSSSRSSSSDSDSDSDSAALRHSKLKKITQEEIVVHSFEKLLLPILKEHHKERYEAKFSDSTHNKLNFIFYICAEVYNFQNLTKCYINKLHRNIHSENNAVALGFLESEIVHVFDKLEKHQRHKKRKENYHKRAAETNEITKSTNSNKTTKLMNNLNSKTANAAEKVVSADESIVADAKDLNKKNHMQSRPAQNDIANANTLLERAESNETIEGGEKRLKETNSINDDCIKDQHYVLNGSKFTSEETKPNNNIFFGIPTFSNVDCNMFEQNAFMDEKLLAQIQENNLQQMEVHRKQLFIDEMILKLQKEKMELNVLATQLQNEKYLLLNSTMNKNIVSTVTCKRKDLVFEENRNNLKKIRFETEKSLSRTVEVPAETQNKTFEEKENNINLNIGSTENCMETLLNDKTEHERSLNLDSMKDLPEDNKIKDSQQFLKNSVDYTDIPTGNLTHIKCAITVIEVFDKYILACGEDGYIYKYDIKSLKYMQKYQKHTESITALRICGSSGLIYTTSWDGYLKLSDINNLKIDVQAVNLQQPLQTIDINWNTAYIGSRWGNIFTYDTKIRKINVDPLCSTSEPITAIIAVKEGPRQILLVPTRDSLVHFRDSRTGLLLRSIDVPRHLRINSILLDSGTIYCATHKKEVYKFDFVTGTHLATLMCGNGAVTMSLYKQYLLVGCYDGYIYVVEKYTNKTVARFFGAGHMVLSLKVIGDKVITSSKNKFLKIVEIPKHVVVESMAKDCIA